MITIEQAVAALAQTVPVWDPVLDEQYWITRVEPTHSRPVQVETTSGRMWVALEDLTIDEKLLTV